MGRGEEGRGGVGLLLKEREGFTCIHTAHKGEMKVEAEVFVAGPAQRSITLIPTTSTCWTGGHSSLHEEPFTGTPHSRADLSQKKVYAFLFLFDSFYKYIVVGWMVHKNTSLLFFNFR